MVIDYQYTRLRIVTGTINFAPLPINAYIEGCVTLPCALPQLEDCVVHIVFKSPRTKRSLRTIANAVVFPFPGVITYPLLPREVTCDFLTNTYCPLIEGEVVQYTLRMFIERTFFVGTRGKVEFRVEDQDSLPVLCLRVDINVVAPRISRINNNTVTIPDLKIYI